MLTECNETQAYFGLLCFSSLQLMNWIFSFSCWSVSKKGFCLNCSVGKLLLVKFISYCILSLFLYLLWHVPPHTSCLCSFSRHSVSCDKVAGTVNRLHVSSSLCNLHSPSAIQTQSEAEGEGCFVRWTYCTGSGEVVCSDSSRSLWRQSGESLRQDLNKQRRRCWSAPNLAV